MLYFITGTSGSAKTQKIQQIIGEKLKIKDAKILLIVPEQASFSTEKFFLKSLGSALGNRIQILSFTRFCESIFKKSNCMSDMQLNDAGRLIIMNEALKLNAKNSDMIISSKKPTIETTNLLVKIYDEFKSARISVELLNQFLDKINNENLRKKIFQIALIMQKYEGLLQDTYLDPATNFDKLCEILEQNEFFNDYEIFVDSFNNFTKQELGILEQLLIQSKNMYVSLCLENGKSLNKGYLYNLFEISLKSKLELIRLAQKNNIMVEKDLKMEQHPRFVNPELGHLESNFFRSKINIFRQKSENINLYQAKNIYDEIDYVARSICNLIAEKKYRYRDIAIISRDLTEYSEIIRNTFERYQIKYFSDEADSLAEKPIMNFVLTAFDIVQKNFNTDEIINLLKTGLTKFDEEDISKLENYSFLWNITGEKWRENFKLNPEGAVEGFSEKDKVNLEKINKLREALISPLEKFAYKIKNTTALDISKALYELITDFKVQDKIRLICGDLQSSQRLVLAEEQKRLWKIFIDILDQIVAILGNKKMSSRRYRELLELVINSQNIDFIPRYADEVKLFALDKAIIDTSKVVFIIGANDGEFPKFTGMRSMLSEDDRKTLSKIGIDLYISSEEAISQEKFNIYKAITSASEKLFVSWHDFSLDGKEKAKSLIVREINKLFPELEAKRRAEIGPLYGIYNKKSAFYTFSRAFKNTKLPSKEQMAIYRILSKDTNYEGSIHSLENISNKKEFSLTDKNIAEKIFPYNDKNLSASQVEKYYRCPFSYFCNYGLNLKELRQVKIDPLEYGNMLHHIFEKILIKYEIEELLRLTPEQTYDLIFNILEKYIESRISKLEEMDQRFNYLFRRTVTTAVKLLQRILEELSQSKFKPVATEFEIGKNIPSFEINLSDGNKLKLIGKIDRVDMMQNTQGRYIRIIDYKSGDINFEWSDILYGINLQLIIYLDALYKYYLSKNKEIIPSAILYAPLKNVISTRGKQEGRMKNFRMDGIILNDLDVVLAMDAEGKGEFIPVKVKNNSLAKSESLIDLEDMKKVFLTAEAAIIKMATELKNGNIKAFPLTYRSSKKFTCDYCPYLSICRHEDDDECNVVEEYNKTKSLDLMSGGDINV